MDLRTELSPYIIMTCCCLHNICERLKLQIPNHQLQDAMMEDLNHQPVALHDQQQNAAGGAIRDAISSHMVATLPMRQSVNF